MRGAAGIVDDAVASWDEAVADFREKESSLIEAERELFNVAAQAQRDPVDLAEWQRLMNQIQAASVTNERIHTVLDSVTSGWNAVTSGWTSLSEWISKVPEPLETSDEEFVGMLNGVRKLGAAQFIVPLSLGALAAAAATMAAIAASVAGFITYLSMKGADLDNLATDVEQMRAAGADEPAIQQYVRDRTAAATKSAQERASYSFTSDIARIAMWIGLGLIAVFVGPQLMKLLPGKR